MSLIRRNNRNVFPSMENLFDVFFNDDFLSENKSLGRSMPAVNVRENETEYYVDVAAPGLKKEDFKLEMDHGMLTVSCENQTTSEQKDGEKVTRREYSFTSFSRSFTLPENASEEGIKAHYKDGVLTIQIKKVSPDKNNGRKLISID